MTKYTTLSFKKVMGLNIYNIINKNLCFCRRLLITIKITILIMELDKYL